MDFKRLTLRHQMWLEKPSNKMKVLVARTIIELKDFALPCLIPGWMQYWWEISQKYRCICINRRIIMTMSNGNINEYMYIYNIVLYIIYNILYIFHYVYVYYIDV